MWNVNTVIMGGLGEDPNSSSNEEEGMYSCEIISGSCIMFYLYISRRQRESNKFDWKSKYATFQVEKSEIHCKNSVVDITTHVVK